jgi:hypothetical protein
LYQISMSIFDPNKNASQKHLLLRGIFVSCRPSLMFRRCWLLPF